MLRRRFTAFENMLLLMLSIIFVTVFYYVFLLKPVISEIHENHVEASLLQEELNIQLEMAAKKERMQRELERSPQKLAGALMPYDNAKNEMKELDSVLRNVITYDISADTPVKTGGIVRRNVMIACEADSYEAATEIVRRIEEGPYRCLVSYVEMNVNEDSGGIGMELRVTYYEIDPESDESAWNQVAE